MSDRRLEILEQHFPTPDHEDTASILYAMDEYFTERAMELLEYMAKNKVICGHYSSIDGLLFKVNGHELLTKEQLFGNFL